MESDTSLINYYFKQFNPKYFDS